MTATRPVASGDRLRRRAAAVAWAGSLLIALLLVASAALLWNARCNEIAIWQSRAAGASHAVDAHTRQSVQAAEMALDAIVGHVATDGAPTSAAFGDRLAGSPGLARVIGLYVNAVPQISAVAMVDTQGDVIGTYGRDRLAAANVSDRDFFQAGMRPGFEGNVIGAPVAGFSDGEGTIFLARPVMARPLPGGLKVKIGMVVMALDVSFFENFYHAVSPGDGSALMLFRRDGLLLASDPQQADRLGKSYLEPSIFMQGIRAGRTQGAIESDAPEFAFDGTSKTRIIALNVLEDIGLVTAVSIPRDLYLARWHHGVTLVLPFVVLICLVIVVFTVAMRRLLFDQESGSIAIRRALVELQLSNAGLQDKKNSLDITFEHMDQGIIMITTAGLVSVCNKRALDLLGLPHEVMRGTTTVGEIMVMMRERDEYGLVEPALRGWIENAATRELPPAYTRQRPNGVMLDIRSRRTPDGGIVRTITDVTERSRLEAQLMRSQRMEAVGQLTAGIAHDFNNVIGIIVANIESASDVIATEPDVAQGFVADALDATALAADLVSGLMAFSRMKDPMVEPVDMKSLLDGTQAMLRQALSGHMEVAIAVAPECWRALAGAHQLQSVLINLATNARAASPQGSRLEVDVANVVLPGDAGPDGCDARLALPPGDYVRIAVQDHGRGMSVATRARIFEPFFTTGKGGHGTGLGMSMVHGTLQQMNGAVDVQSIEGQGTTVLLYLKRFV